MRSVLVSSILCCSSSEAFLVNIHVSLDFAFMTANLVDAKSQVQELSRFPKVFDKIKLTVEFRVRTEVVTCFDNKRFEHSFLCLKSGWFEMILSAQQLSLMLWKTFALKLGIGAPQPRSSRTTSNPSGCPEIRDSGVIQKTPTLLCFQNPTIFSSSWAVSHHC
uniref:AlNc14C234G9343 protein n=1 Tax=Albugo laibachii Nc14 TaxID=890382 RepID=F0WSJ8_9STRA|nr:AlNc14C234G9343 [Albugo laibachii Nc14]|eukprot:CCA24324.1 AlNc14C234G9343 [Albugo laibachii Nc14]